MFDPKARKHVFLGYDSNSTAYLLQDIETGKLTRARNIVFNERKVVGFTNEPRETEDDLLFDVTFEDQNENENSQNVVKIETKEEGPEIVIKPEVLIDDESSSCSGTENQIELTRSSAINPDYGVGPDSQVESTWNLTLTPKVKHRLTLLEGPLDQVHRDLQKFLSYRNGLKNQVIFSKHHK